MMCFQRTVSIADALKLWEAHGGTLVICGQCAAARIVKPGSPWPAICAECRQPFEHRASGIVVVPSPPSGG